MTLNRGYKYKLYVNKTQSQLLFNHCFSSNQAWNILVGLQRKEFKLNKDKLSLNNKIKIYSIKTLLNERKYLTPTQQDDLIKKILRNRKISFNTKVVQQTRVLFNMDFKKKMKQIKTLRNNHYKKTKKKFELFNFKKSNTFGFHSFQTTLDQYKLLDYIDNNGKISKKWKILRLFRYEKSKKTIINCLSI